MQWRTTVDRQKRIKFEFKSHLIFTILKLQSHASFTIYDKILMHTWKRVLDSPTSQVPLLYCCLVGFSNYNQWSCYWYPTIISKHNAKFIGNSVQLLCLTMTKIISHQSSSSVIFWRRVRSYLKVIRKTIWVASCPCLLGRNRLPKLDYLRKISNAFSL